MSQPKRKPPASLLERMLGEASWLLSHAQALGDYGRHEEADAEYARAAVCEEQVASLLDVEGQELEAAIHRVSAASCREHLGQYTEAVTLLRAALSAELRDNYRADLRRLLERCLRKAKTQLARSARSGARRLPATS